MLRVTTPLLTPLPTPSPTAEGAADENTLMDWVLGIPLYVVMALAVAFLLRWLLHLGIDRVVRSLTDNALARRLATQKLVRGDLAEDQAVERTRLRAETVGAMLRSLASFVVFGGATIVILSRMGIDVAPLIASAGIAGIALGFGAQSLVKDFISGVFIILEDQYGVGDVVDAGDAVGTVEDVGLRVTRLRDVSGVVWYVPNGSITALGNRSQGYAVASVDVPVPYSEDLDRVSGILMSTAEELARDHRWDLAILDEPPTVAVESMTAAAVTVRVLLKTVPGQNLPVARELRLRVVAAFERAGVTSPGGSPPPADPPPGE